MLNSATTLACELLKNPDSDFKELRIHTFADDEAAHDDELTDSLYGEFLEDFDDVEDELSLKYGPPSRIGNDDDSSIPLCGVFRFALWQILDRELFVVAAHEDRGCPILLLLGATNAKPVKRQQRNK